MLAQVYLVHRCSTQDEWLEHFTTKKEVEQIISVFQMILITTSKQILLGIIQASMEQNMSIHLLEHMITMYPVLFAMPPQELLN